MPERKVSKTEFKESSHEPFFSSAVFGKILLFFVLIFSSGIIQTSLFRATGFFPATPDLLLAAVVGIAIFDGERSGAVSGIAAGVVAEALGGTGIMLFPLFYMMLGYTVGVLSHVFLVKNFPSWMVHMFLTGVVRGFFTLIYLIATVNGFDLINAATKVIIPEFILTFIFAMPMFFITRACARPFHKSVEMN